MGLKVIGTGFGRTGTDSMRLALDMLGFGPCHHMRYLLEDETHMKDWRRRNIGIDPPSWGTLFEGFNSCLDWPSAAYWPEIVAAYPDAKVLLTYRSAESWWASFEKTILPIALKGLEDPNPEPGSDLLTRRVFNLDFSRENCIAAYEANVALVHETVPQDRLLVHSLGDGWEPLCAFLEVPVPDTPYPRSNSTKEFQNFMDEQDSQDGET